MSSLLCCKVENTTSHDEFVAAMLDLPADVQVLAIRAPDDMPPSEVEVALRKGITGRRFTRLRMFMLEAEETPQLGRVVNEDTMPALEVISMATLREFQLEPPSKLFSILDLPSNVKSLSYETAWNPYVSPCKVSALLEDLMRLRSSTLGRLEHLGIFGALRCKDLVRLCEVLPSLTRVTCTTLTGHASMDFNLPTTLRDIILKDGVDLDVLRWLRPRAVTTDAPLPRGIHLIAMEMNGTKVGRIEVDGSEVDSDVDSEVDSDVESAGPRIRLCARMPISLRAKPVHHNDPGQAFSLRVRVGLAGQDEDGTMKQLAAFIDNAWDGTICGSDKLTNDELSMGIALVARALRLSSYAGSLAFVHPKSDDAARRLAGEMGRLLSRNVQPRVSDVWAMAYESDSESDTE
jgi:hypothetical protein